MSLNPSWPFLRIAHRGAAALEPENTLRAIERALSLGVEMVEIDVRPCADGTLVVFHDDALQRITGGPGRVSTSTLAQLRTHDVGKGERIPTLEEVLALIRGRALVNIDQKRDNLAPQLLKAIDRAGNRQDTILTGNALTTFRAMRQLAPAIGIAVSIDASYRGTPQRLLARWTTAGAHGEAARLINAARAGGADGVTLQWRLSSPRVVERLKRAGLSVLTWTVDDLRTMRSLRAAGVDGITSNRPDLLLQIS